MRKKKDPIMKGYTKILNKAKTQKKVFPTKGYKY